jgi:hypothetical protein
VRRRRTSQAARPEPQGNQGALSDLSAQTGGSMILSVHWNDVSVSKPIKIHNLSFVNQATEQVWPESAPPPLSYGWKKQGLDNMRKPIFREKFVALINTWASAW